MTVRSQEKASLEKAARKMNAVVLKAFGGPDFLCYTKVPLPRPADNEILVKIEAAGVNPVDTKIRSGAFARFVPQLPAIIGRDICGTVVAAGKKVAEFAIGDRVLGMLDYDRGAYAEFAVATVRELAPVPAGLNPKRAAALPVASLTAWQALFEHGKLKPGQRVLIHGASGGVGHYAVQFAALHGAKVIGTCNADDVDFVRDLGASIAIDYASQDFEKLTGKVHLVLDLIGGKTRSRSWEVIAPGGILVSTLPGPKPEKRTDVSGREVVVHSDPQVLGHIAGLVAKKSVRVELANVFPLSLAGKAHQFLQEEHARGKTVLSIAKR